ncbi:MAG TPA: hypothetical protein VFP33_06915 [Gallionella sp.]|nr:hypothetical protein [Gallionella sp.]
MRSLALEAGAQYDCETIMMYGRDVDDIVCRLIELVASRERARCAEVCRSVARTGLIDGMAAPYHHGANQCAKAIEVSK